MPYRYLHLDVFTARRFEGNQLAVLPDARGLSEDTMQAIAREMAFSETTFVLPAERDDTDFRVRIFTPERELPMAGHPTIGTAFALVEEGAIEPSRERVVFGLGVGPTPVDLEWRDGRLSFAWMTQPLPEFGDILDAPSDLEAVARAVGLDSDNFVPGGIVQVVSCGVPFLFVPVRTRALVDRAIPDRRMLRDLESLTGAACYLFTLEPGTPEATAYSRMFMAGLPSLEDPATGGAAGPFGAYLVRHGLVPREARSGIRIVQGVAMQRPSELHVTIHASDDESPDILRVRVGGTTVLVATGSIEV